MAANSTSVDWNIVVNLYDSAYFRGLRARLWAMIRRRPWRLLSLNECAGGWTIYARRFAGRRHVPLRQIRGSENRTDDFDAAFHPRANHDAFRWRGVAQAWMSGIDLPPVELIKVGEIYFVRDGHHRISVAAALGVQEIDALVTEWIVETAPAVEPEPAGNEMPSTAMCSSAPYGERLLSV
jgi:hypothetical protein